MWRPLFAFVLMTLLLMTSDAKKKKFRKASPHYPKQSLFWATDFFVRGCKNFIEKCPGPYKVQHICAKNYNGDYRDFANYCEMQYENCNTWRNWRVFKREWC
ncbi:hypothetical protein NE865_02406 [Phthorimaea operculella]|nr:hypothetical protein NE865_02406 [Phthorimaea operculella]